MDRIALETLRQELLNDSKIVLDAFSKAGKRLALKNEVGYEGCAHHLCRLYNAVEQTGLRVAKAFENHIDDEQGWHTALLARISIPIVGMRPALIPKDLKNPLEELKGFRHVFVHAYDLELDPEKLALLLKYAARVAAEFPALAEAFIEQVKQQHGLDKVP
ncbi:MAG TPA: hypothetical protein VGR92_10230 [Steroidobacteraceae bacterium]|nr:hypothetical protein [Steroidobacteraceae bacterium]